MAVNIVIIVMVLAFLLELLAIYHCNKERIYYKKQYENLSEINADLRIEVERLSKEIIKIKGNN